MIVLSFDSKKILVVGDVMLDKYNIGNVDRISPEAPVPVFKTCGYRMALGGAANVAANLTAANQRVSIASIVGCDSSATELNRLLDERGIERSLLIESSRPTTVKARFLVGSQQMFRCDDECADPVDDEIESLLVSAVKSRIAEFDACIVSDYAKGLLTHSLTQRLINLARSCGVCVLADVKGSNGEKYSGATLLKPNASELQELTGLPTGTLDEVVVASRALRQSCNSEYVMTTCGAKGMVLVGKDRHQKVIPSVAKEVFDVTGAGDTAIAYLTASYVNGFDMPLAMKVANVASGVQVAKLGTSTVSIEEVSDALEGREGCQAKMKDKVVEIEHLTRIRDANLGKTIVFTNGCFDILHVGHVRYLRQAAALGDVLVVGVNSDASVRKIKGSGRPVNSVEDRVAMLACFDFIDHIVIFEDETPYGVIESIQPDLLVKGGDYSIDQVVGRDIVEARGGEVRLISFIEGKSSTSIINRIAKIKKEM